MKTILAGVGTARGFNAKGDMIFKAQALTDSGFNISTSKEEIRGGQGASLQGQYYHTTSFGVNLKDAVFDLNYLALQVGGQITQGGDVFKTEQVTVTSSQVKVQGTPQKFGNNGTIGWYNVVGEDTANTITFSGQTARVEEEEGTVVCVTYIESSDSVRVFEVATQFVPSEIHLIFDMPLFNASAMSKESMSTESQVGLLTVDVPRFQFNGSVDLSTAMAGASSVDISGVALQAGTSGCSGKGIYARIQEEIFGRDEFENVYAIVVEDSDVDLKARETQTLKVLALHNDNTAPSLIDNKKLTFVSKGSSHATVGANSGLVTATSSAGEAVIEVKVTSKPKLEARAVVTVTGE